MNGEVKRIGPEGVTAPRLVYMKKGDQGYGFNLHGEKGVQGQTISAVDKGSPAELGGLREGDRVIEVNGFNVENMKHGEVVGKIKQNPSETRLLVIDSITDKYLKENGRPITEDMANLLTVYQAPEPTPEQTPVEPEPVVTPPKEPEAEPEVVVVDSPSPPESAPPAESTPEAEPPSQPESPPETQQEASPKDAIDEINNVLEQEEQKPVEPEVNKETEDSVKKAMEAARRAAKGKGKAQPTRKEVKQKGEREPWQTMTEQFNKM